MRIDVGRLTTLLVAAGFLAGAGLACRSKGADEPGHGEKPAAEGHEEEAEHDEGGLIELSPEQAATAGVKTAKVEKRSQAGLLEATAQIEAAADRQAKVGARIPGRIVSAKAGVGDAVRAGTVLAVVDSPDLGRGKADYLSALAASEVAQGTANRERTLFEKKISSEREWREAEATALKATAEKDAAENRLHALGVGDGELQALRSEKHYSSTMAIVTPIDGTVVERAVTVGQMVQPSDALFTVMDLREVWILVDIYDRDLPQVKAGQKVSVKVGAYPDAAFAGRVQSVGAVVEPKTRAVKARVVLPNPEGALKPGMFATVTVEGTSGPERAHLVVPAAAVQRQGEEHLVFVPRGEREFEARKVKVARQFGDLVEIEDGLAEGETVVTSGSFAVKSQMNKGKLGGGHEH